MSSLRHTVSRVLGHPVTFAIVVVALFLWAGTAERATVQLLAFLMLNILLAQSINLLTGIAGQISLGHAGFFGIGAYASAILMKDVGFPFVLALVGGTAITAVAGWLLAFPAGRVREFYLAMMTAGFGLLFYEIVKEWNGLTGGVMGMSGVPSPMLQSLTVLGWQLNIVDYFRLILVVTALVLVLFGNFVRSRFGRAYFAIQASEVAAGSIGIARGATKRQAFMISAGIAGLSGAFYAHLVGYLGPDSFTIMRSVEVLVMAVVGGMGTVIGPIFGAALFTYLPERLQAFASYQFMVYGLILVVIFLLLRRGIAGALVAPTRFTGPRSRKGPAGPATAAPTRPVAAATEDGPIVEIRNLSKNFEGLVALDGVSLALHPGRITALIGPNGSGKSTLINVACGIYKPSGGEVLYRGRDIANDADHQVAGAGIVRTFQDPRLVPSFTVRENIILGAHLHYRRWAVEVAFGLPAARREEAALLDRAEEVMRTAGLSDVADDLLESLPYGYRRLVEVGRAMMARPEVIMLDEPAAGLSEAELAKLGTLITDMKAEGYAIMLIEHHMDFISDIVDDVVVLDSGREIYRGDMEGMRRDPSVIAAYLGVERQTDA